MSLEFKFSKFSMEILLGFLISHTEECDVLIPCWSLRFYQVSINWYNTNFHLTLNRSTTMQVTSVLVLTSVLITYLQNHNLSLNKSNTYLQTACVWYTVYWKGLFVRLEINQALYYAAKDCVFYVSKYGYQSCFHTRPSWYIEKFCLIQNWVTN